MSHVRLTSSRFVLLALAAALCGGATRAAQQGRAAAYEFDEFVYESLDDARPRVERFVEELKRRPGARGYVVGYSARLSYDPAYNGARAAAAQVLFLARPLWGGEPPPFVTVDGGLREKESVELFVVPAGASPPAASPAYPKSAAVACARLNVAAPLHVWSASEPLTFRAKLGPLPRAARPAFRWTVGPGRIVSGQGTSSITVEQTGGDYRPVRATVVVEGFADECRMRQQAESPPLSPAPAKLDEFGRIRCGDELARLDNLADSLDSDPRLVAYLVVRDGADAGAREARARASRMKAYLTYRRRLPFDRVVSVVAGRGEKLGVELWVAPRGGPAPVDEATRRAGEVLSRRPRRRPGDCADVYDRI